MHSICLHKYLLIFDMIDHPKGLWRAGRMGRGSGKLLNTWRARWANLLRCWKMQMYMSSCCCCRCDARWCGLSYYEHFWVAREMRRYAPADLCAKHTGSWLKACSLPLGQRLGSSILTYRNCRALLLSQRT